MLIAIPSKGRPATITSAKILKSAMLFVPADEVADYERSGNTNVVGVPRSVKGITATRNYILKSTADPWVVMVDDDVKSQGFVKLLPANVKHIRLDEKQWIAEMVKLFELTEQLHFRLWGVATQSAARSVYPWKPILTRSYVTGSFMGIVNDGKVRFDERYPVKEDYELTLRCIRQDGGVVAARYLYWENSHWKDPGGCSGYRTQLMELRCIKMLANSYPGMIRRIERGGSTYSIDLDF